MVARSGDDMHELRRRASQRTLARALAARQQHEHPNKGIKRLADEIFARLEAEHSNGGQGR